jgi:hypothetical protein
MASEAAARRFSDPHPRIRADGKRTMWLGRRMDRLPFAWMNRGRGGPGLNSAVVVLNPSQL